MTPSRSLDESQHYIYGHAAVTLLVHYVKPGAASMDRGKTRVSVSDKVDGVMNEMLTKLAAKWVRRCKAAIRSNQADARFDEILKKEPRQKNARRNAR